jgi:hypothetical protein
VAVADGVAAAVSETSGGVVAMGVGDGVTAGAAETVGDGSTLLDADTLLSVACPHAPSSNKSAISRAANLYNFIFFRYPLFF